LNASLNQENKYKDVISSDGLKLLTRTTYTKNVCSNDNCPISQEDFKEGDEITVLPCKHGFKNGTVEKWLETQRPECPICRYKFDSVEIKNKDYRDISLSNNADRNLYSARNEFLNSLSSLENIIHPFGRNIVHPFGRNQVLNTVPHSYIENLYNNDTNNGTRNNNNNSNNNNNNIIRSEEADLNEAIMNSLKDASMNNPT
jgi:ABC-type antimicrobial peptide transport system permease subunit